MRLSIRNQLDGVVHEVTPGDVMGTVRVRLAGGARVTAAITLEAVEDLGLVVGDAVVVLVKSTDVALAAGATGGLRLSIRNQIPGTVTDVDHGMVMTTVKVAIAGDQTVTSAITKDAAQELAVAVGDAVSVLMKSTEVAIARR